LHQDVGFGTLDRVHAYFDTDVYDHIQKMDDVTEAEVVALQRAVDRTDLTVYFGPHNAEELWGQWENDQTRSSVIRRLRVASRLTRGFRFFLKASRDVLGEAIAAYAGGFPAPSPMLPDPDRAKAIALLRWATLGGAADPDSPLHDLILEMLAGVKRSKDEFLGPLKSGAEGFAKVERIVRAGLVDPKTPAVQQLWQRQAKGWAHEFARFHGIGDDCMNRGLEGLLDVRPLRLAIAAMIARSFAVIVEGGKFHRNDGYDMWHAVSAAPADTFVTFDRKLRSAIAIMPIESFHVVSSVRELLELLVERSRPR
jgi:hypothetical protein